MSRKTYVRPKKVLSEMFRFLQILVPLDHKFREHLTKSWGNFDLPALMLRDSVSYDMVYYKALDINFRMTWTNKPCDCTNHSTAVQHF